MKKVSIISFLVCLVITFSALFLPIVAADSTDNTTASNNVTTPAPTETPEPEPVPADSITLTTEYPRIDALPSGSFEYNITMNYKGQVERIFDLKLTGPSGWDLSIEPTYETGKKISSITIDASYSGMSKNVKVIARAPSYPIPDPGDYKILMQTVSGDVSGSLELVARISAKYAIYIVPVNQRYDTSAQAGKNNVYSIQVSNTGSATLENITFTSDHPDEWEIKFSPEKLETLKAAEVKTIDVSIKPPPRTVAGDYMIHFSISSKQVTADQMSVRVSVKTPSIWGWVGVIIIVLVVVALFFVIMKFGRR